ncbi:MAG TPA: DUF1360 domain-containing protein [Thermoleophilaceae bacterium]|jgi:hypothetical protein|nr:DUF1360 domain-containing protein [Thermoleophilaceae bacterium]
MERATVDSIKREHEGYAPGEAKPLGGYALLATAFNAGLAGALYARREDLPERISAADLALLTVGTHKLSRLIAKDKVTSPLRAPFARYEEDAGPSEVSEAPRGTGLRRAIGELITCPFCIGQWIAAAGLFGLLLAPRTTRFVASIFAIVTGSDFLQVAYKAAQDKGL